MNDFYKDKKVLITGHTGFKGSWLTQVLVNMGAKVVGISLVPDTKPNMFEVLGLDNKIKNYFVDIENFETVNNIFKGEKPEIVFHLAAQAIVKTGYLDPLKTFNSNTIGTANILEAVRNTASVKSSVIITTDKVYENKEWPYAYRENDSLGGYDPYSASKAAADIVANSYIQSYFNPGHFRDKHNSLVAIARAGNVIGGGDWAEFRLIPDIIRAVYEKNEKVKTRHPQAVRPWQHVLEPLSGYMMLAKALYEGNHSISGSWNFGPNNESFVTVEELINHAISILGKGEYYNESDNSNMHEANLLKLDINKAHSLLSWKPKLKLQDNLKMTFDWYKHYYEVGTDIVDFTNKQIDEYFNLK